jgi:hypothetical protein
MISKKAEMNDLRLFFLRLPRLRAVTPAYRRQALRRARHVHWRGLAMTLKLSLRGNACLPCTILGSGPTVGRK